MASRMVADRMTAGVSSPQPCCTLPLNPGERPDH